MEKREERRRDLWDCEGEPSKSNGNQSGYCVPLLCALGVLSHVILTLTPRV